jgi:aminopeptidase N
MCNHNASTLTSPITERKPFQRLPTTVVPTHYALHLLPDLGHYIFDAVVDVTLTVREAGVTELTLNAVDLAIHAACVRVVSAPGAAATVEAATSITVDTEKQTVTLTFATPLPVTASAGDAAAAAAAPTVTLSLAYTGTINDKLCGLYRSTYTAADGSQQTMACSQFEAVDARRCLPCWDEPALKATFSVTITAPKHLTAVSNMPITVSRPFVPTPAAVEAAAARAAAAAAAAAADAPAAGGKAAVWATNAASAATETFFSALYPHASVDYAPSAAPATPAAAAAKKDNEKEDDEDGAAAPVQRSARCDNVTVIAAVAAGDSAAAAAALGQNGSASAASDLVTHVFARSPIMSSYLLTLVLGEFDVISTEIASAGSEPDKEDPATTHYAAKTVTVRCLTMPGTGEQGRYALDIAARSVTFFEQWFGIQFPLPKLDCLAIPDFLAGAMEGFGCITFRETLLLLDPAQSSRDTMQEVAMTVSHEVAHQWFGNLVTMEWWTHLWLNEGFATWAQYAATHHLHPEFQIWTQFLHADLADALALDGLASSHAIEVPVGHPSEIDEIFDAISYSKGCAVIRMLIQFLGEQPFRTGLCAYLRESLYGNATTEDLWRHLEAASGQPVRQLMEGWTKRVGYPLLTVTQAAGPDAAAAGASVTVTQTRFLADGSGGPAQTAWFVPVTLTNVASGAHQRLLLKDGAAAFPVPGTGASASVSAEEAPLVLLNLDRAGCYRVTYPAETWVRITAALRAGAPALAGSVPARLTLASDSFALARAGLLDAKVYLSLLLAFLETETSYHVWAELSAHVCGLLRAVRPHPRAHGKLSAAFSARVNAFTQRTAWAATADNLWAAAGDAAAAAAAAEGDDATGEAELTPLFRQELLSVIEDLHDPTVTAEASDRVRRFFAGQGHCKPESEAARLLAPDVRSVAYRIYASSGGDDALEALSRAFIECPLAEEKDRLASAFAAVSSDADADRVLNTLLAGFSSAATATASGALRALTPADPVVRSQDVAFVLRGFASNPAQLPRAWAFVKKHWDGVIYPEYEGSSALRHVIALANGFRSEDDARDVAAFFQNHPHEGAEKFIEQCLERVRTNAAFTELLCGSGACEDCE